MSNGLQSKLTTASKKLYLTRNNNNKANTIQK